MKRTVEQEVGTELATQCLVSAALEKLATNLAAYLALGVHKPAENGRQAVVLFLEQMADTPLEPEVSKGGDRDEVQARALTRIGEIIMRIRAAAHL